MCFPCSDEKEKITCIFQLSPQGTQLLSGVGVSVPCLTDLSSFPSTKADIRISFVSICTGFAF